ncbi:MAG: Ig-like domain-containing protein [Dehalococcoidia bacterium]
MRRRSIVFSALAVLAGLLTLVAQAPETAEAHGSVDQAHVPSSPEAALDIYTPWGQTFTPARSTLLGFDLGWCTTQPDGVVDLAVKAWSDSTGPTGGNLAVVTGVALPAPPGGDPAQAPFTHVDLTSPLNVSAGSKYIVMVTSTDPLCGAKVAGMSGDPYNRGAMAAFFDDGEDAFWTQFFWEDLAFRTYYDPDAIDVDQQQIGTPAGFSNAGGSYPWGQTFTPAQNNVVGFDVRYCTRGHNPHTIVIRQVVSGNALTGPNLVAVSVNLPASGNPTAVTHVDLPLGGVALTPGAVYGILVIDGNGMEHVCASGNFGNAYPAGTLVFSGATTDTSSDGYFKTYYLPSFVAASGAAPDLDAASDLGNSSTDNRTKDNTPTFTGPASDGSTVRIFADGVEVGMGTASGGAYSITTSALSDGWKNITRTVDGGSHSPILVVSIDTTAPPAPTALQILDDSGADPDDNITNDSTPRVHGLSVWSADQATSANVLVDGVSKGTINTQSGGGVHFFQLTTTTLAEGVRSITATVSDVAGNTSAESTPLSVTIDTTAPDPPGSLSPADGSATADNTPTFDWGEPAGATGYDFQADNSGAGFPSPEINLTNQAASTHTPSVSLSDGAYSWRVRARDAAGNLGAFTITRTLAVDANPPDAPILSSPADGALTNDQRPAFDWNDVPTAVSYELLVDNNADFLTPEVTEATLGSSGFTPGSNLVEGTYNWKARACDSAGNVGPFSSVRTFTIDTSSPAAPSTPDLTAGTDTGVSDSDNITSNATPSFTGTAEANSTVELFKGATSLGTATANGSGNWTFNVSSALSSGANSIMAKATDAAGNTGAASAPLSVTVDTTAPTSAITFPAGGGLYDAAGYTAGCAPGTDELCGTSDTGGGSDIQGVEFSLRRESDGKYWDGTDFTSTSEIFLAVSGTTSWTIDLNRPGDGGYTLKTRARDVAGNLESTAAATFTIDTSSPAAPSTPDLTATTDTGSSNTDDITQDDTPSFRGTAEPNSTVELFKGGTSLGTTAVNSAGVWTFDVTSPALDEGVNSITAKAKDAAGNISPASASISVTVDLTGPDSPALTAPTDGAATSDQTPTFDWEAVTGAVSYDLLVDNNSDFSSVTILQSAMVETEFTPGGNLSEDTYYWKVLARDSAGNVSAFSSTRTVTVDVTSPAVPTLVSPIDGASTNDQTPGFDWNAVSGAVSYDLLVDNNADFNTPEITRSGETDSDFTPTIDLAPGMYRWKVRATDAAGNTGLYSDPFIFTIDISVPTSTITFPVDGSTFNAPTYTDACNIDTDEVCGTADAVGGTAIVLVEVSLKRNSDNQYWDGDSFDSAALFVGASGTTSWIYTLALPPDGSYTLSSRATDAAGNVESTAVATFTIDTVAPAAPSLDSPAEGAGTNDPTPNLDWSDVAGAATYDVLVDDNADFSSPEVHESGLGSSAFTTASLLDGSYNWKVRARDVAGNIGPFSSVGTFTVDTAAPAAPTLQAPADSSATADSTPAFDWGDEATDAASYSLQIDDNNAFSSPFTKAGLTPSSYTLAAGEALADGAYFWRVMAIDATGNISTSAVRTFTVDTTGPPAVTLLTPIDNGFTADTTPAFDWEDAAGANSYEFMLDAAGESFATPLIRNRFPSNVVLAAGEALVPGEYEWKVRAKDALGNAGPDSAVFSFTVDTSAPTAPSTPDLTSDTGTSATDNITDVQTPSFAGTAKAGGTIEVFAGATSLGTAAVENTGAWTLTSAVTLAQGSYAITAIVTDAAGNPSPASAALNITVELRKCNGQVVTLPGTAAAETLSGGAGVDVILGLGGDDTLNGLGGGDHICGGAGNDILNGGNGNDFLLGEAGNDELIGGVGNDDIEGGAGTNDIVRFPGSAVITLDLRVTTAQNTGQGSDTIGTVENATGGNAGDTITGTNGANRLFGNGGDDTLNGLGGDDLLQGGGGNDTLNGGTGDDELRGDAGNDVINGGGGVDEMFGGPGVNDTCNGGPGSDTGDANCESGPDAPPHIVSSVGDKGSGLILVA